MLRRHLRLAAVLTVAMVAASVTSVTHAAPTTELKGEHGPPVPLKNAAMIKLTKHGYRYMAGQQDSRLTVRRVSRGLRFADTGTRELREIPRQCARRQVARGIAAVCRIPGRFDGRRMFLEIWPRLGDDVIDGSTLPQRFRMWVLADAGRDVVRTGAGADFVNGAQGDDTVSGGAGNDWIRTGIGDDEIRGGPGHDKLVGVDGHDVIRGGGGNDRVYGGAGRDRLWADSGDDGVSCGAGADAATVDRDDRAWACERLTRR